MHSTSRRDFLIRALQNGRPIPISIEGNCMHPLLVHGQNAVVYPVDEIKAGDVVLVRDQVNQLLAHRILSLEHDSVITAGDRNDLSDPPILRSDILGRLDMPEDREKEWTAPLATSELKVLVHPNAIDSERCKDLSHAFAVDIAIEENLVSQLLDLRENGWATVAIHSGARQHLSDLPDIGGKVAVFVGYDVGKETDPSSGTIGASDVGFVARTAIKYWNSLHADVSVAAIIGFHMRRTESCHG
ncbi:S24/S26 family peptidase [Paenibacillus kobensis]|uniref:S24/S26 family peptidase n=1 Tax=Paenibacillus kobensis TaxID=59841 RepID=UPI000FD7F9E9|nr:S24/S26 family peptidase [Paenibacillus kobensis]